MTISPTKKFIAAIALQALLLLVLILLKASVTMNGTEVVLHIMPVDPRDPLRGDYITFRYDISRLDPYLFETKPTNGQTIYVPLAKSGKYWQAQTAISTQQPQGSSQIFIKAKVVNGGASAAGSLKDPYDWRSEKLNPVDVQYGIEEFFIPEGTGQTLAPDATNDIAAKVIVDRNGNAVLKQVYVNGKEWPQASR